jgi:hypothetical protein
MASIQFNGANFVVFTKAYVTFLGSPKNLT